MQKDEKDLERAEDASVSTLEKLPTKKKRSRKKLVLGIIGGLAVLMISLAGTYTWLLWSRIDGAFTGGITGLLRAAPLTQDSEGRTNILIIGMDEGTLTDSIMVISVNQATSQGVSISLPRDLWVERYCWGGRRSAGKINETFHCARRDGDGTVETGARALMETAGMILGIDVHYFVNIDEDVLIGSVDVLGGIYVEIDRTIIDNNTGLRLSPGRQKIDGETALKLSRARGQAGGVGVANDFHRGLNQQLVLRGIQETVIEDRSFLNPVTALNLVESFGNSLTSNFQTNQIRTLISVGSNTNVRPLAIAPTEDGVFLVRTDRINEQSVVIPAGVDGYFNYSRFQTFFAEESRR
ncbi:LCP family protein [Candidatus Saccharibacteria bacterium]|nr:LCP family protein [Candidatus Saccharibacteria bacterium]